MVLTHDFKHRKTASLGYNEYRQSKYFPYRQTVLSPDGRTCGGPIPPWNPRIRAFRIARGMWQHWFAWSHSLVLSQQHTKVMWQFAIVEFLAEFNLGVNIHGILGRHCVLSHCVLISLLLQWPYFLLGNRIWNTHLRYRSWARGWTWNEAPLRCCVCRVRLRGSKLLD